MAGAAVICVLMPGAAAARLYHVAPDGSDLGAGTETEPFRTIGCAAALLQAGDRCLVRPGLYRETVRPAASGTPTHPIRIEAASTGEVVITGCDPVPAWTARGRRIMTAPVDGPVDQLYMNGRRLPRARFPNRSGDPYQPKTVEAEIDGRSVRVRGLPRDSGSWRGATLWVLGGAGCVAATASVTGENNGVLELADTPPLHRKGKAKAFLEGVAAALDAEREWYASEGQIYLRVPADMETTALDAEVTRRRWAFDLSDRRHVTVSGFRVLAASANLDGAEHCVIEHCRFKWPGFRRDIRGGFNRDRTVNIRSEGLGLAIGGQHNEVRDSVVAYCLGDGISVYGISNAVVNCVVHDCNLSASDCAPVTATGVGHKIMRCTLFNAGRCGLLHRKLKRGRIERNHIHHVGLMTSDLGGTYTYWTDGAGTVLAYNRIHDVHCPGYGGSGIYIDNGSSRFEIHHNLCYDTQLGGIHVNTPVRATRVHHNTCAEAAFGLIMGGGSRTVEPGEMTARDNIFAAPVKVRKGVALRNNCETNAPGFLDPGRADFRLRPGSPCVRAGDGPAAGCFDAGAEPWVAGSDLPESDWETGVGPGFRR